MMGASMPVHHACVHEDGSPPVHLGDLGVHACWSAPARVVTMVRPLSAACVCAGGERGAWQSDPCLRSRQLMQPQFHCELQQLTKGQHLHTYVPLAINSIAFVVRRWATRPHPSGLRFPASSNSNIRHTCVPNVCASGLAESLRRVALAALGTSGAYAAIAPTARACAFQGLKRQKLGPTDGKRPTNEQLPSQAGQWSLHPSPMQPHPHPALPYAQASR